MISVIIPLYNKENSILKTIKSVLNQTFTDFELLVINDGSTDNSLKIISQLNDDRLKIINKKNGGVSSARNKGIKEAKYKWIALLDGDDLWNEQHLKNISNIITDFPDAVVISSGYGIAKKDRTLIKKTAVDKNGFYNFFKISLKKRFIVNSSSIAFNKFFYTNLFFNEELSKGEDIQFWEELAKRAPFYLTTYVTSTYIDDSENKAVYSHHPLNKTHIFTLNTANITNNDQKTYYINFILHSVFLFFKKQQSLKDTLKIYFKHAKFIGLKGFFIFIHIVLSKRFTDKI